MSHRVFDRVDAVVGEHIWHFADFATLSGIMRVGGNRKGVFTRDPTPESSRHPPAATMASHAMSGSDRPPTLRLTQYANYGAGDAANNPTFSMASAFLFRLRRRGCQRPWAH